MVNNVKCKNPALLGLMPCGILLCMYHVLNLHNSVFYRKTELMAVSRAIFKTSIKVSRPTISRRNSFPNFCNHGDLGGPLSL